MGSAVGSFVGSAVGSFVGSFVGDFVGSFEGDFVGFAVIGVVVTVEVGVVVTIVGANVTLPNRRGHSHGGNRLKFMETLSSKTLPTDMIATTPTNMFEALFIVK